MKTARTLLILGIWVAVLPYLGFPYSWKQILFVFSGIFLMYLSYTIYKKEKNLTQSVKKSFDNFSENIFNEDPVKNRMDSI